MSLKEIEFRFSQHSHIYLSRYELGALPGGYYCFVMSCSYALVIETKDPNSEVIIQGAATSEEITSIVS